MSEIDIYRDNNLRYKLNNNEYILLDKAWELIEVFKNGIITMHPHRNNLINMIRNKYTIDEFSELEKILEKLFWNLRSSINYENERLNITEYNLDELHLVKNKLKEDIYYRSFVNKIINIDDKNKKIYYKKMEGSANILAKDYFNLLTGTILFDRNIYEQVMKKNLDTKDIKLPEYYFQMDYGFPNLNLCCPLIGSDKLRKKKIQKMFYDKNAENNWFKLII